MESSEIPFQCYKNHEKWISRKKFKRLGAKNEDLTLTSNKSYQQKNLRIIPTLLKCSYNQLSDNILFAIFWYQMHKLCQEEKIALLGKK